MGVTILAIAASGLSLIGIIMTVISMWAKLDDERRARQELEDALWVQRRLQEREVRGEGHRRFRRPPTNGGPDDGWGL